jgi:hypothetical protein
MKTYKGQIIDDTVKPTVHEAPLPHIVHGQHLKAYIPDFVSGDDTAPADADTNTAPADDADTNTTPADDADTNTPPADDADTNTPPADDADTNTPPADDADTNTVEAVEAEANTVEVEAEANTVEVEAEANTVEGEAEGEAEANTVEGEAEGEAEAEVDTATDVDAADNEAGADTASQINASGLPTVIEDPVEQSRKIHFSSAEKDIAGTIEYVYLPADELLHLVILIDRTDTSPKDMTLTYVDDSTHNNINMQIGISTFVMGEPLCTDGISVSQEELNTAVLAIVFQDDKVINIPWSTK